MSRKITGLLVGALLGVLMSATSGAAPAQAEPPAGVTVSGTAGNSFSTLSTCYGGAVRSYFQLGGWGGDAGPYTTSTRCLDINVRNDSTYGTQACVIFIDRTSGCNYWTYLPARSGWFVVASNVRDGTRFKVRFSNSFYRYDPLVAHIAY